MNFSAELRYKANHLRVEGAIINCDHKSNYARINKSGSDFKNKLVFLLYSDG